MSANPTIERPAFADGYQPAEPIAFDPKPWTEVAEIMNTTTSYLFATTRADGRAHSTPVWGLIVDGTFVFSTAPQSVKAKNLHRDPRCFIQMQINENVVLMDGVATPADPAFVSGDDFLDRYEAKYHHRPKPEDMAGSGWIVKPVTVLFWNEHAMLESQARYRFE